MNWLAKFARVDCILARRCWLATLLVLLVAVPVVAVPLAAQERAAGKSYFGRGEYIEYIAGNLPVIISAPHGGNEKPTEIPDRQQGTFSFDRGTQQIARATVAEFHKQTGGWPHVVICRLRRTKLDCNREIVEAAAGNPLAEQAWREYQGFLDEAQRQVIEQHGRGLFIDLHGHGHAEQRLELGYLHSRDELQQSDALLNSPRFAAESSLRAIAALNRRPYAELLRGPLSFGDLMEKQGFPATPSPATPHPTLPYFRGGYNAQRHGRDAAPIAGLQIETNFQGVRDTPANHQRFAKALYEVVSVFLPAQADVAVKPYSAPQRAKAAPPIELQPAAVLTPAKARTPAPRRRMFRRRSRAH